MGKLYVESINRKLLSLTEDIDRVAKSYLSLYNKDTDYAKDHLLLLGLYKRLHQISAKDYEEYQEKNKEATNG